ncbi:MAG TPA: hypothetical protein VJX67_15075 [Blastocatellia bacterium]|nr:hypothetical protein [Blastocatellia bacterium]
MSKDTSPEFISPSTSENDLELTAVTISQVDKQLDALLAKAPESQREQIRRAIHAMDRALIAQGAAWPGIDSETLKSIAESINKDSAVKIQFLTHDQTGQAAKPSVSMSSLSLAIGKQPRKPGASIEFAVTRDDGRKQMMWACLIICLLMASGCIIAGIHLSETGHKMLGSNLLTMAITALLAFLGGLGTGILSKPKLPRTLTGFTLK